MELLKKYKLYVIVVGVMLSEAFIFWSLWPKPTTNVPAAAAQGGSEGERSENAQDALAEVPLGDSIRVQSILESGRPVRIDLKVVALVTETNKEAFVKSFDAKKQRVREAIAGVIRKASREALLEGELIRVKRAVRDAVATALGADATLVEDVIIPDYTPVGL